MSTVVKHKPSADLDAAAEVVATGWTQGTFARNARGVTVSAIDPKAVSWCLLGAVRKVCGIGTDLEIVASTKQQRYENARRMLWDTLGVAQTIPFNDAAETTKDDVINLLHKAASSARKRGL